MAMIMCVLWKWMILQDNLGWTYHDDDDDDGDGDDNDDNLGMTDLNQEDGDDDDNGGDDVDNLA